MKGFKTGAQTGAGVESHGRAMGFMKGGPVKVKDTGNMPAKPQGDSEQEKEAGGRPKVRPGYMKGGAVKGYTKKMMEGGKVGYMKGGKAYMMKGGKMCRHYGK